MSTSTLVALPNPSIRVMSPDARKASVIYQPMPENVATAAPRIAPSKPALKFDYFNPSGNHHVPEILQERAALERIAHAFSRKRED